MSDILEYRCFIGGLSWSTSDRSLEDAFQKFGHVIEAKVVIDRDTGRSRGFGFVTFDDKKAMEEAIDRMHGMDLDGRSITVDKAQPRSAGGERGERSYGSGGARGYSGGGGGGGGGSGECFKCGQRGHFARECPNGEGYRGSDRYSSRSDRYGGSGSSRYGPDRNGDRYGGRPRDGGSRGGSGNDRYNRDRSGPYDRPSGGGSRSSYDDRH